MLRYTLIGKIQKVMMHCASIIAGPIIYQAGGYSDPCYCDGNNDPVSTINSIDVTVHKDRLKHCGDLPEPLSHHAMIYTKQRLYVFGGKRKDGSISSTVWSTSLDFTKRDLFGTKWVEAGKLPCGMYGQTVINIDGEIYIMGGNTDKKYCKGMKQILRVVFDGNKIDSWDVAGYMPEHLHNTEVKFFKRKLIIVGGDIFGTSLPNNTVYSIGVTGNVLSPAIPVGCTLPHIAHPVTFVLNNRFYYGGGLTYDKTSNIAVGFNKGVYELLLGENLETTVSSYQGVVPADLFMFDHVVGRERSYILGGRNESRLCQDVVAMSS